MSLTPEQIAKRAALVDAYARVGTLDGAARQVGIPERTAQRWMAPGGGLVARAREAREKWLAAQADDFERQSKALIREADGAIATLADVAKAAPRTEDGKPDRAHHLGALARVQAAIAILDRAGHKPVERVESTMRWEDARRDLERIDAAELLQTALAEISASAGAQPAQLMPHGEQSEG